MPRGGHNAKPGPVWWTNPRGYIEGRVWIDGKRVYRKQHRWFMEQHLGRPLRADEDVHHINGVKTDNRLENLEVVPHGKHSTMTNGARKYRSGYSLSLTDEDRAKRSREMKEKHMKHPHIRKNIEKHQYRAALSRAKGGV